MNQEIKIAFLITVYNKQKQLVKLINCLANKCGYDNIYVHIDKKSAISPTELKIQTSPIINVQKEFNVYWGGFSQLQSILNLIESASEKENYDFFVLLSGQDLPIKPYKEIIDFLSFHIGKSFITSNKLPIQYWNYKKGLGRVQWYWFMDKMYLRGIQRFHVISHYIFNSLNLIRTSSKGVEFYGGSDWWILPGEVAKYCLMEFKTNRKLRNCFKYSFIPTEMFFQTVISNSDFQSSIEGDSKRYIKWGDSNNGHPELLTVNDKDSINKSNCLFARKFDLEKDEEIFNYFIENF